ncbi:MAG: hypothetical protein K5644_08965 [Lachnospiraceae bacterium]|nr:hypothetical protein [Lachnospiraceae bacterium]
MYDRVYLDARRFDDIINGVIKEKNLLGLYKDQNIRLYMYAFALGYDASKMVPSSHRKDYVRDDTMEKVYPEAFSFMNAVYLSKLLKNNEKIKIDDNENVYNMAEQYVNAGLDIIAEEASVSDDEAMMFAALRKLDKKYKELFENED